MSTRTKSTKIKSDDLRMVFLKKGEYLKVQRLIREGKVPRTNLVFIPLKIVSLLEKEGVEFGAILEPIETSDLTLQQREDLKNKKAILMRSERDGPIFFVKKGQ